MKRPTRAEQAEKARLWARRLDLRVRKVLAEHPDADPDNVRHTLILLEQPPLERLQRSLIRGRALRRRRKGVHSLHERMSEQCGIFKGSTDLSTRELKGYGRTSRTNGIAKKR